MSPDVILWVLGAFISVLGLVVGFLANWNHGQDKRMGEIEKDLAKHMRHTAENYVRGHEVSEVRRAVQELTHKVDELLKVVHELVGKQSK
jgi:hypothetical protein